MLIETLVLISCVEGAGCAQSTSAYYLYNKDLQNIVNEFHNVTEPILKDNHWIVYFVAPVYTASSGKTASIPITNNTSLNLSIKNSYVGLQFNY